MFGLSHYDVLVLLQPNTIKLYPGGRWSGPSLGHTVQKTILQMNELRALEHLNSGEVF